MENAFDPYYEWLGIPPEERPINHYRLLGIREFEGNSNVISNAADRQMAHVRNFSSGPHSAESQQILNELSVARVCLLNAEKKAAYDETLRQTLSSSVEKAEPEVGLDWIAPASSSSGTTPTRKPSSSNAVTFVLRVVVGGAVGIGAALFWITSSSSPDANHPESRTTGDGHSEAESPARVIAKRPEPRPANSSNTQPSNPTGPSNSEQNPTIPLKQTPSSPPEPEIEAPDVEEPRQTNDDQDSNAPQNPIPLDPANPNGPIEVLERLDLAKHVHQGKGWRRTEEGLETGYVPYQEGGPIAWSIAELDFEPPEEYRVTAVVQRSLQPNGKPKGTGTLAFGAIVNGDPVTLQIDALDPPTTGLEEVNSKQLSVNETRREGRLLSLEGKTHYVNYTVLKDRFQLSVDGKTVLDWAFPPDTSFQLPPKPFLRNSRHFWFGTRSAGFVIPNMKLYPFSPPPDQKIEPAEPPIDVLASIESNPASMTGELWQMKPEGLLLEPPERKLACFQTSIPFPENYRIEAAVRRVVNSYGNVKGNQGFDIGLMLNGKPCLLGMDLWIGRYTELQTINRDPLDRPAARINGRFLSEKGREHLIVCTVNNGRVTVDFDRRRIMNWKIQTPDEVPITHKAKTINPRAFWLRSYQSHFLISHLKFIPLPDSESVTIQEESKHPLPSEKELAKPRELIQQILGQEIESLTTPAEHAKFAAKVFHEIIPTTEEIPARFALLELTRDHACDGDDVQLAITAEQQLIDEYQVDSLQRRAALARKIHEVAPSSQARQIVAAQMIELVNAAAEVNRWELVDEFSVLALENARRSRNKAVLSQAVRLHQRLESPLKEWKAKQSSEKD